MKKIQISIYVPDGEYCIKNDCIEVCPYFEFNVYPRCTAFREPLENEKCGTIRKLSKCMESKEE